MVSKRDEQRAKYEELAHKIVSDLMPYATVELDDHISGRDSEADRQIDVSARWLDGDQEYLMVVQVRDRKRRADVNTIGEFKSVIQDVKAHKGVLVCSGGFSKQAITYARNTGISLFSLHDATSTNWATELTIPIVWVALEPAISFGCDFRPTVTCTAPVDPEKGPEVVLSADGGNTRIYIEKLFEEMWNAGEVDRGVGEERDLQLNLDLCMSLIDQNGRTMWLPVTDVRFSYSVSRRAWLSQYRPADCRGLIDFLDSESFIPSYMSLADVPIRRDESFIEISDPDRVVLNHRGVIITAEAFQVDTKSGFFHTTIRDV